MFGPWVWRSLSLASPSPSPEMVVELVGSFGMSSRGGCRDMSSGAEVSSSASTSTSAESCAEVSSTGWTSDDETPKRDSSVVFSCDR